MAGNKYADLLKGDVQDQAQVPTYGSPAATLPPAPTNKYADLLGGDRHGQEVQVRTAMMSTRETTPDQAAQVLGLAQKTGLGPDLVSRNYDTLSKEQAFKETDYRAMVSESPALARFVSDRHRAAAVQDDLKNLSAVEETAKQQSIYTLGMNAINNGLAMFEQQIAHIPGYATDLYVAKENVKSRLINMINEATGSSFRKEMLKTPRILHDNAITRHYDAEVERTAALSPESQQSSIKLMMEGEYGKAGRTAFYGMLANAPNLAVMLGLGRAGFAAEMMGYAAGTTGAAASAENAALIRDQEGIPSALANPDQPLINPDVATGGAYLKGAEEALFEYVGTYLPLREWENAVFNMGGKAGVRQVVWDFSKTMLRTVFTNATEEALTQGAQDLTDYYTGVNPEALQGIGLRMADAAAVGGLTGGTMVSPAGALSGLRRRAYQAHQTETAQANAQFVAQLSDQAAATNTAARSPELMTEFVRETVAGTPMQDVQLDPTTVKRYFQSKKQDPTQAMQKLGLLPEFGAAEETGTNIKMPLEKFIKDVVHGGHPELINDIKFSEEGLSVNETKAFNQETAGQVADADQAANTPDVVDPGPVNERGLTMEQQLEENRAAMRADVQKQLEAAGRSKEEADVFTRIIDTTAQRLGVDPLEFYRQLNVNIQGPDQVRQTQAGEQQLNQARAVLEANESDSPAMADAKRLLSTIDTAEKAAALTGEERAQYLAALDEVYGGREARAQSLGFTDESMFHGTTSPDAIDAFRSSSAQSGQVYGRGTYVTENPETANVYTDLLDQHSGVPLEDQSGAVYPLRVRTENTFGADRIAKPGTKERLLALMDPADVPKNWDKINKENRLKEAVVGKVDATAYSKAIVDSGYDSIEGYGPEERNVISSRDIRSQFAAFDPRFAESRRILAQSDAYLSGFQSKLIRTIEEKMPNAAPVDQVRAIVRDVKAEEKKWLGLDDLLNSKEKVTKQEVLDHLRANQLQIQDVTKTDRDFAVDLEWSEDANGVLSADGYKIIPLETGYSFRNAYGVEIGYYEGQEAAKSDASIHIAEDRARDTGVQRGTKYGSYTLPGGENYREVLFTLPDVDQNLRDEKTRAKATYLAAEKKISDATARVIDEGGDWQTARGEAVEKGYITQADLDDAKRLRAQANALDNKQGQNYTSGHWDEANILAFTRLNERTDADGKRVLHIEEIQSDWHQDGRKRGYKGDVQNIDPDNLPNGYKVVPFGEGFIAANENGPAEGRLERATREDAARAFVADGDRGRAVPDAPFRKTWHEFALKKIIRMAAEGGFDKVTWTTGEQQADRYNLAKKIDRIQYAPSKRLPGTFNVIAYDLNGRDSLGGGMMYSQTEEQIEEIFGKEIAKKIVADEGTPTKDGTKEKALSGLQLAVGGEGMKGFYDKIVPDYLRKFGKKYGATVGETNLSMPSEVLALDDGTFEVDVDGKSSFFQTESEADAFAANGAKVHSLDITPALKDAALNQGFELFQGGNDPRGYISIGENSLSIQMLAKADRSTFIHEAGHFIVEMMKMLSEKADTPQQVKDDFAALMKHVGNDGGPITTEQHEELARSFEAYMMEGKAPSRGLRSAFNTIKTWMVDTYQHLLGLNVNLTDDVRQVFDRVLATDDEIEAATGRQSIAPLFNDPAKYNLTPEQFAEYQSAQDAWKLAAQDQMRGEVMEDIRKEESELYQAELARVTADVTAEVDALPVYQALAALQTGKTVTGESVDTFGLGRLKLDRAAVVELYGEDVAKEMPRATTTRDGGLHPDQVAQLFGFVDGSELIDAMRAVEPRQAVIDRAVEAEMNRLDPKLFQSTLMPEQAMRAIHNNERARVIRLEMEYALSQSPGVIKKVTRFATKRMPSDLQIRQQVERVLGAKKVSDITPNVYRVAERKAAAEAGKALAAGDYDGVFEAKRKELINHELYRAAVKAREEMSKDMRFFRKLNQTDEKLSKTREPNLVNTARAVLAAFGIGKEGKAPIEYLKAMKAYDPQSYESAHAHVIAATEGVAGNYKSITFDEYQNMRDAVKALWSLAKSTKEIEVNGRKVQTEQIKGELIGQIYSIAPEQKTAYTRSMSGWEKMKSMMLGARASLTRVEAWAQAMDVTGQGGFTNYIFRPIAEATTKYRLAKEDVMHKLTKIFKDNQAIFTHERIRADELRHEFKDKSELLMAVLHSGNESNLRKLLVGRGWGSINEDGTLDRSRWDAFRARMEAEGKLTKADYDFAQSVWDLNESLKPDAQKAHKAIHGSYFNEITANELVTPYGTYKGGYIPAKLDVEMSETAKVRADREAIDGKNDTWSFPTTGRGSTISRVENFFGPLSLNMNLLFNHIDWSLRFAHIEPRVREVARVVNDETLRENLKLIDGSVASEMLIPWLQRSASQRIITPSDDAIGRAVDRFASYVRRGVSGNILVGNVTNAAQQLTGLQVAAAKVKPTYLLEAQAEMVKSRKKLTESVMEMSPWMRSTQGSTIRDAADAIDQVLTDPSVFHTMKRFSAVHGQFLQAATQNYVNTVVWSAAFNQAVAEGMNHQDAVFAGDAAVRTTQGTQNAEDISRFETGTEKGRIFKYFYSYFNMLANMNASEFQKIQREVGLKKGLGKLVWLYNFGIAIPAVSAELIVQAAGGGLGPDDDEGWALYALKTYFGSQFRTVVAMVPGVGMLANAVYGRFTKEQYDDRLSLSPAIAAIESATGVPAEIYKRFHDKARNERKLTRDVLGLVGLMTQLPVQPLSKPINYARDVRQGRIRPRGPIDYARGLITGKGERR